MEQTNRKSGIDILGDVAWGTHFCHFYRTREDLLSILVPYFKAGLANNEFCIWVTAEPMNTKEAAKAMTEAVPDFASYVSRGQMEIVPHDQWYLRNKVLDLQKALDGWVGKLNEALARGYDGMRVSGDTIWLEKKDWKKFTDYEAIVNSVIDKQKMIALCGYSLAKYSTDAVFDVMRNHGAALIRNEGKWEIIELSAHAMTREALAQSEERYRLLTENAHEAIAVVQDGRIVFANAKTEGVSGYRTGELLGQPLTDFVEPDDVEMVLAHYQKRMEGEEVASSYTFSFVDKWDQRKWLEVSAVNLEWEGRPALLYFLSDITERKTAEDRLRDSEEKYRHLVENTNAVIYTVDEKGVITYLSPAFESIFGRSTSEFIGKKFAEFLHADDLPSSMENFSKVMSGGFREPWECRMVLPGSGETYWVQGRNLPVYEGKNPVGMQGVLLDITARKQTYEALQKREQEFRALAENAPDIVCRFDGEGRHLYINSSAEQVTGIPRQDFIGKTNRELGAPEDLVRSWEKGAREVFETSQERTIEYEMPTRDGSAYFQARIAPESGADGSVESILVIARDVTEQKRALDSLRASEEKYRLLVENAHEAILLILIEDASLVFANRKAEEISGYPAEELMSRSMLEFVHPDDREMMADRHLRRVRGQDVPAGQTFRYTDKWGNTKWVEMNTAALDWHGRPAVLLFLNDITERKRAEDGLRESEQKYRLLVENAHEAILVVRDEHLVFANSKTAEMSGYSVEELVSRSIVDFIHPDDREMVADRYGRRLRGEDAPSHYVFRFIDKWGNTKWVELNVAVSDWQGEPALICFLNDITERKRREEELRLEAVRHGVLLDMQRLMDSSETEIFDAALEGSLKSTQSEFGFISLVDEAESVLTIHGWSRQAMEQCAVEGRPTRFSISEAGLWAEGLRQRMAVLVNDYEAPNPGRKGYPPGHVAIRRFMSVPVFDGDRIVALAAVANKQAEYDQSDADALGILTDRTWGLIRRRRAEQSLRNSEERFRRITEELPLGMVASVTSDTGEDALFFNKRYTEITGYGREDTPNFDEWALRAWPDPETRQAIYAFVAQIHGDAKASGKAVGPAIVSVVCKDGSAKDIEFHYMDLGDFGIWTLEDVTQQKQAEESLKASEEKYRLVVENTYEAIIVIQQGDVVFSNRKTEDLLGYLPEDLMSRSLLDFVHPEDQEMMINIHISRMKGEYAPSTYVARFVDKWGASKWVELNVLQFAWQGFPAVLCFLNDITERKRAEDALKASEEKYRLLAENVTDVIWITDMNLNLTYMSPSAERVWGYGMDEAMRLRLEQMLAPASYEKGIETFAQMMAEEASAEDDTPGPWTLELQLLDKKGSPIWVEEKLNFVRDHEGRPVGLLGVSRDIHERKKAEEELRASEERYRLLAENVTDVIWTTDMNLKITYVSPSAEQLWGYSTAEAMNLSLADMMTPDSCERAMEVFAAQVAAVASGQKEPLRHWALEIELLHRDGSVIPVEEQVNFVHDNGGRPVGLQGVTRDIRERKKAEQELRASEERYRLLAENATDVIWITDMNLKFTYVSPSAERFSGWSVDEAMGMTVNEMLTPESAESAMKVYAEHVAAEVRGQSTPLLGWTAEVEMRCKDGSTRWVEAKLDFLRTHEGRAVGLMGVGRDISDRKKAEEALRGSEERFRTVYQKSPIGIILYDSKGLIVDMNNTALEIFGLSSIAEEKSPLLLENPQVGQGSERLRSGRTVRYEGPFDFDDVKRQGLYYTTRAGCAFLDVLITPLGGESPQAPDNYLLMVQDVTDRKTAEEALRRSEEKYRVLVESSPDAIISLDPEGHIHECNSALCDLAGYTFDELRLSSMNRLWSEKVLESQSYQRQLDRMGFYETEVQLIHRDGHGIPVWAKVVRPNGKEGDTGPTMVYMRDVAERKKVEELKDEFIGLVSHELRSPLTVIIGAVNTALDEFHHLSRQDLYQLLQDASAEAESLSHLLGNLLELSRVQANRLFLHVEPISIEKTVQKVVAKMRHLSSPAHQLVIDIPKRLPPVQADELRLERILYNLLENSVKFSPKGGVIRVFARRENDQLTVGVNDQGIGISLRDQSQLFKPFHQVGEPKNGTSDGAGLGLLVCRRLVEAHGGHIWVESKPHQGATFSFTLPTGTRPARRRPHSKQKP